MNMTTVQQKQARYVTLHESLRKKANQFQEKSFRARSIDKSDMWWAKYKMFNHVLNRFNRGMRLPYERFTGQFGRSNGYVFDYVRRDRAEAWWREQVADRKERGRQKFENLHTYAMWFLSNSFGADYGQYVCDRCGITFYHSPSTIKKAKQVVFNCCCGSCTNTIIGFDYPNATPYE